MLPSTYPMTYGNRIWTNHRCLGYPGWLELDKWLTIHPNFIEVTGIFWLFKHDKQKCHQRCPRIIWLVWWKIPCSNWRIWLLLSLAGGPRTTKSGSWSTCMGTRASVPWSPNFGPLGRIGRWTWAQMEVSNPCIVLPQIDGVSVMENPMIIQWKWMITMG